MSNSRGQRAWNVWHATKIATGFERSMLTAVCSIALFWCMASTIPRREKIRARSGAPHSCERRAAAAHFVYLRAPILAMNSERVRAVTAEHLSRPTVLQPIWFTDGLYSGREMPSSVPLGEEMNPESSPAKAANPSSLVPNPCHSRSPPVASHAFALLPRMPWSAESVCPPKSAPMVTGGKSRRTSGRTPGVGFVCGSANERPMP